MPLGCSILTKKLGLTDYAQTSTTTEVVYNVAPEIPIWHTQKMIKDIPITVQLTTSGVEKSKYTRNGVLYTHSST